VLLILLKSKLLATPGGEELEESQILPDTVINLFKGWVSSRISKARSRVVDPDPHYFGKLAPDSY
jgi:hypothetical protein